MSDPLVARYEIRVGKRTRGRKQSQICEFYDDYTDIVVIDNKTRRTMGWNIKEAKEKMGLLEEDFKVVPYLANLLLIAAQETDWDEVSKKKK